MLDPVLVRRALAERWGLVSPLSVEGAVDAVVALHATDPVTTALSVWARSGRGPIAHAAGALTAALEEERTLVRVLGMRQTLHVVRVADLPVVRSVYAERLGAKARARAAELCAMAGVSDDLEALEALVLEALGAGDATTTALAEVVPALAGRAHMSPGKPYGGMMTVGGRVLDALGIDGGIVRARRQGGWKVGTCSWAALDRWLPDLEPYPAPDVARARLVRRYLAAFGPARLDDVAWWTGLPKRSVSAALATLTDVVEVRVQGWDGPRLALADSLDDLAARRAPVGAVFLPSLDPSIMGYQARQPWLDPAWHELLVDRSGNVGPTVWHDGLVVGGWAQRRDGEVRYRLLGEAPVAAIDDAASALAAALGDERVAPRFPVPLTKALTGATGDA